MNVCTLSRSFSLGFGESHITRDLDQGDIVLNWGSAGKGEIVSAEGILSTEKWKYWRGTEIVVIYRYQERRLYSALLASFNEALWNSPDMILSTV
jgi:hypothetical protein